jgi:hypothetical protein
MKKNSLHLRSLLLSGVLIFAGAGSADLAVESSWQALIAKDGSILTARHEAAAVAHGDDLYLLGGRGNRPLERYSTSTGQWENLGLAPFEMHHMQPVVLGDSIYVLGALTCCYPREEIVNDVYAYDIQLGTWDVVGSLPATRIRGSAAVVTYDDKIYVLGGNVAGHDGGAVPWFDEYNPLTGIWQELPDAPNARDHFSAVVVADQLVAAAGRQTALPNPAARPVRATDIYDFSSAQWRSAAPIPTVRAGAVSVAYDGHVIVAGGEINTSTVALDVVEAYDVETDTWQALPSMTSGRHGSGGGVVGSHFYMFSGAPTIGGASEIVGGERIELPDIVAPDDGGVITPPSRKSGAGGGGSGVLLLAGLLCVRGLRKSVG